MQATNDAVTFTLHHFLLKGTKSMLDTLVVKHNGNIPNSIGLAKVHVYESLLMSGSKPARDMYLQNPAWQCTSTVKATIMTKACFVTDEALLAALCFNIWAEILPRLEALHTSRPHSSCSTSETIHYMSSREELLSRGRHELAGSAVTGDGVCWNKEKTKNSVAQLSVYH